MPIPRTGSHDVPFSGDPTAARLCSPEAAAVTSRNVARRERQPWMGDLVSDEVPRSVAQDELAVAADHAADRSAQRASDLPGRFARA